MASYNAALKLDGRQARPLYGRGVAKLNKGDAGGAADLQAAKGIEPDIAEEFALFGVSAPEGKTAQPAPGAQPTQAFQPAPLSASAPAANCAAAETHWKSAEEIKTLAVYQDHLARFPNCEFGALAAARIEALKKK